MITAVAMAICKKEVKIIKIFKNADEVHDGIYMEFHSVQFSTVKSLEF
jgi:hypothetical protein